MKKGGRKVRKGGGSEEGRGENGGERETVNEGKRDNEWGKETMNGEKREREETGSGDS